jgi:dUTP pyrophosphatase
VRIRLLRGAKPPRYATAGAVGADLSAHIGVERTIAPGERWKIPTGVAVELGPDEVAYVTGRSGLFVHHGLMVAMGVIDGDYRGELSVMVLNVDTAPAVIKPGDRIAQLVVMPVRRPTFEPVDELTWTERGERGFGHTGRD